MSDSDGASAKCPPAGQRGGESSCAPRTPIRQDVQSSPPTAMLKGELPAPPDAVESRVSAWVPRPFKKLVPTYRVDQLGLVVTMPGRGSTSLRWVDVQPSLEFSHEIRTEYEGYKSAQKRLVLRTRSGHPSGRCRIELPKLREPAWISVYENSWEVGRAAMLQLLHHAPSPVSVSTNVFLDLEINPGNWKRAWLPKLVSQLYMLAAVAAGRRQQGPVGGHRRQHTRGRGLRCAYPSLPVQRHPPQGSKRHPGLVGRIGLTWPHRTGDHTQGLHS